MIGTVFEVVNVPTIVKVKVATLSRVWFPIKISYSYYVLISEITNY